MVETEVVHHYSKCSMDCFDGFLLRTGGASRGAILLLLAIAAATVTSLTSATSLRASISFLYLRLRIQKTRAMIAAKASVAPVAAIPPIAAAERPELAEFTSLGGSVIGRLVSVLPPLHHHAVQAFVEVDVAPPLVGVGEIVAGASAGAFLRTTHLLPEAAAPSADTARNSLYSSLLYRSGLFSHGTLSNS